MVRARYLSKPDYYKAKTKENRRAVSLQVREYLNNHPCVDCGEDDPVVLEFDHVFDTKTANISDLVKTNHCWNTIIKEIQKCEVRCANCHRRITVLRRVAVREGLEPSTTRLTIEDSTN